MRSSISYLCQPALIFNSNSEDGMEAGFDVDKFVLLISPCLHYFVLWNNVNFYDSSNI